MASSDYSPFRRLFPGIFVAATLAALSLGLAALPAVRQLGLNALTLAILMGIVGAHALLPADATPAGPGIDFSKSLLLRVGIVLYGFRISFQ